MHYVYIKIQHVLYVSVASEKKSGFTTIAIYHCLITKGRGMREQSHRAPEKCQFSSVHNMKAHILFRTQPKNVFYHISIQLNITNCHQIYKRSSFIVIMKISIYLLLLEYNVESHIFMFLNLQLFLNLI